MDSIASASILGVGLDAILIAIIIGLPIFFLWRWLFRKKIKNRNKRAVSTWIATIVTAPLCYVIIIAAIVLLPMYYPDRDFDRNKWFNDKDERYEYVEDIIKSKMLIGKTSAEVEKILGIDHFNEQYGGWFYELGTTPSAIDPDSMEILFKDGRVTNVIRHRHY